MHTTLTCFTQVLWNSCNHIQCKLGAFPILPYMLQFFWHSALKNVITKKYSAARLTDTVQADARRWRGLSPQQACLTSMWCCQQRFPSLTVWYCMSGKRTEPMRLLVIIHSAFLMRLHWQWDLVGRMEGPWSRLGNDPAKVTICSQYL